MESKPNSYGTADWFRNKLSSQGTEDPAAYFAYSSSGYHRHRYNCLLERLGTAGKSLRGGKILDIGCATGDFLARVAGEFQCSRAVGVDFVDETVQRARFRHPGIEFYQGGLPTLDFDDESFDAVFAMEVLYYLPLEARLAALKQIARVMKPGGVFLFSSVLGPKYFSIESSRRLVEGAFQVDKVWVDFHRLYHLVTSPLMMVNRLRFHLDQGGVPTSKRLAELIGSHPGLFQSALVKIPVRLLCALGRPILRSERMPLCCAVVARIVSPRVTQTNVAILATKSGR